MSSSVRPTIPKPEQKHQIVPIAPDAMAAIKGLSASDQYNLVQLKTSISTESLSLVSTSQTTLSDLHTIISPISPRFSFYRPSPSDSLYPTSSDPGEMEDSTASNNEKPSTGDPSKEGSGESPGIIFIHTFPEAAETKEKMLMALMRRLTLKRARLDCGLRIVKRVECEEVEDLTAERIREAKEAED